jgi:hypothetical protein
MPDRYRDSRTQWAAQREDGLRRLSALTVGVALASAAATGVLVVAAQHASAGTSSSTGDTASKDGLRGPDGAPVPGDGLPVGLSSGS